MSVSDRVRWAACLAGTVVLCVSASGQDRPVVPEGFVRIDADDIKPGTLYGDTRKPGMYVQRVRFGPGQGTKPHYHDQDRYITVLKGTWWVALGADADVYTPEKMTPLKPGSFIFEPANGHHYDQARDEEVVVQIIGPGPVRTTQVAPTDASTSGPR
jgi:quercetin dioxygenase-like cupin family protein